MTKTFTSTSLKKLSNSVTTLQEELPEQKFYESIKPRLDALYRVPSEETIAKILRYANRKR